MKIEEVDKLIEDLKKQGMSEDDILSCFYAMFCDDKITSTQLEGLSLALGYEFTEEFKNLTDEEKKHFCDEYLNKEDDEEVDILYHRGEPYDKRYFIRITDDMSFVGYGNNSDKYYFYYINSINKFARVYCSKDEGVSVKIGLSKLTILDSPIVPTVVKTTSPKDIFVRFLS